MQGLIGPLKELAEFEELCKNKKKDVGMIRVCGCVNSQKSHMMYALGDGCKYKVIACSSETKAKQIYEEYRSWTVIRICIRRKIFSSIRQISEVKNW